VLDHQVRQLSAIDQDDPWGKVPDIIASRLAESRRGDKDAIGGTETDEAFDEALVSGRPRVT
jgi:hypothetical protein